MDQDEMNGQKKKSDHDEKFNDAKARLTIYSLRRALHPHDFLPHPVHLGNKYRLNRLHDLKERHKNRKDEEGKNPT